MTYPHQSIPGYAAKICSPHQLSIPLPKLKIIEHHLVTIIMSNNWGTDLPFVKMSGNIINYYIREGITLSECLMIKLISFFCRCSEEFHYEQQPANFTSWKRPYHQQKLHFKTKNMGQFWGCSWVKKLWRSYIPVIWISA